ncbi:hypothetical protein BJ170DRAFT_735670 [Xylariales sp. AK1849]|nr:hypothetical protein BJ170DRAFT_735670 [Xylariales sp. AK1849]
MFSIRHAPIIVCLQKVVTTATFRKCIRGLLYTPHHLIVIIVGLQRCRGSRRLRSYCGRGVDVCLGIVLVVLVVLVGGGNVGPFKGLSNRSHLDPSSGIRHHLLHATTQQVVPGITLGHDIDEPQSYEGGPWGACVVAPAKRVAALYASSAFGLRIATLTSWLNAVGIVGVAHVHPGSVVPQQAPSNCRLRSYAVHTDLQSGIRSSSTGVAGVGGVVLDDAVGDDKKRLVDSFVGRFPPSLCQPRLNCPTPGIRIPCELDCTHGEELAPPATSCCRVSAKAVAIWTSPRALQCRPSKTPTRPLGAPICCNKMFPGRRHLQVSYDVRAKEVPNLALNLRRRPSDETERLPKQLDHGSRADEGDGKAIDLTVHLEYARLVKLLSGRNVGNAHWRPRILQTALNEGLESVAELLQRSGRDLPSVPTRLLPESWWSYSIYQYGYPSI